MTPKKPEQDKKKPVNIKLHPKVIERIEAACEKTGLKKNTIIEQGIEKRLKEILG